MLRLATGLLALAVVLLLGSPAGGQPAAIPAPVDVIEVAGLLDEVLADHIERSIDRAERNGAQALVLQMNVQDAVISRARATRLAERIHGAAVPVTIWVGPSGARAYGLAGQLLGAAVVTGMAPGSRIGNFGVRLSPEGFTLDFGAATDRLVSGTLGADEARALGALRLGVDDRGTPTLGDFVVVLDGVEHRGRTLETAEVITQGDELRRRPTAPLRSYKLELLPRLMHTVASPPVAYLLLAAGLALLVFEFFTAGVGVAGVVGAGVLVLACYGLVTLPTRWWAFALVLAAFVAIAVDVQTGVPRFWTGVGVLAFTAGSVALFRGFPLPWITLLAGVGGMAVFALSGMPSMVRTRFATPTVGREWMIGLIGDAVGPIAPDGVVRVQGAQWRARTNRATPIAAGDRVRVVAIDGITLEVEPEGGGARDYRERRR